MLWLKHTFRDRVFQENAVKSRLDGVFNAAGRPAAMLLVKQADQPDISTQWLRLPDAKFVSAFPEFSSADESELPKKAIRLIGDSCEFQKIFECAEED